MQERTKHCLLRKIIAVVCAMVMMAGWPGDIADASNFDPMSSDFGFQVDMDRQQMVTWKNRVVLDAYYTKNKKSLLVGSASVDIGFARDKEFVLYNHQFYQRDTTMLNLFSEGKGNKTDKVYGYTNYLRIQAPSPNSGDVLRSVTPVDIPGQISETMTSSNSLSYSIGGSGAELGWSSSVDASQSFVESALNLYNASDIFRGKVDITFDYTDQKFKNTWNVYGKYAYYLSQQKASFTYLTKKTKYKRSFIFSASYYLWNNIPSRNNSKWIQEKSGPDDHTQVDASVLIIPPFPQ